MLHLLKRKPFQIQSTLRDCLVFSYALEPSYVEPYLAPGLALETLKQKHQQFALISVGFYNFELFRPSIFPEFLGQSLINCDYRLHVRYKHKSGKIIRGTKILRSDTNKHWLSSFGNFFSHAFFNLADMKLVKNPMEIVCKVRSAYNQANLDLKIKLDTFPVPLPKDSEFTEHSQAKYLLEQMLQLIAYERKTHSLILQPVKIPHFKPKPVSLDIHKINFFEQAPFKSAKPRLLSAFYLNDTECLLPSSEREVLNRGIF